MINKAIFLDRDGTLNVDKGYKYKPEDLEIIPGVIEGLKKVWAKFSLIIVTNQSGIARGLFTENDYAEFKERMHRILMYNGIYITQEYFCPHLPEDNCNCRKPKTGMLEEAAKDFHLNLDKCWMIGDHLSDIQAGKNAGCKTIHVLTGHITTPIKEADFAAGDMVEAANYILQYNNNK